MPLEARGLDACHNILDLRERARRRLPGPIFHYLEGGAETEFTARWNTEAFDVPRIVPRCLEKVDRVDTSVRLLGQGLEWPLLCSPTGASRFYHPLGELAVARAAAKAGAMYGLSVMSTHRLEDVAAASPGPKLFQLLVFKDRGITRELIERARAARYPALCITVDAAVRGKRERELRVGLGIPMRLSPAGLLAFSRRPAWCLGQYRAGPFGLANFRERAGSDDLADHTHFVGQILDATATWDEVAELVQLWGGPFALKGVMSAEDARRAADIGVSALIVSNHGGRQLDGAAAPIEVLPEIADAVGGRVESTSARSRSAA